MQRLPLIGGSYTARSIIASAQRCINLYPEINPKDSLVPVTHYQRPGLKVQATPTASGLGRGVFRASNGNCYTVVGQGVYYITPSWQMNQIGTLVLPRNNPVSFIDNGTTALLVDGGAYGYTITLGTNDFAQFSDPSGLFTGADTLGIVDGFILWNVPGTNQFGSTLDFELTIDPTYIASKSGYPDPIKALAINRQEIFLIGTLTSEVWYNSGGSLFPFTRLPGVFHEHGTVATFSVASQDINTYFLGQDRQGQGIVFRMQGYKLERISNFALEYAIRKISRSVGLADAVAYCYQVDGHTKYVLSFPNGNQTWVWDESTQQWHQLVFSDSNGFQNRHRAAFGCFAYGKNIGQDWENGAIYDINPDWYYDSVAGVDYPITRVRTFPHIGEGTMNLGMMNLDRPVVADGKRVQFSRFQADIECGLAPLDAAGNPPQITLRWSDDRGRTWNQDQLQTMGNPGEYLTQPQWLGLGIARDRVFELEYSFAGEAALNGAWVEAKVLES